ncbi:hypothetical protein A9P82_07995 [Arachidicoccus ginsenosidimutans]|uniref:MutS-related protein n=1 Tax=Arachidicoccus sp. BS20 TaxID=1850526 RepID=UPI0007F0CA88|nr:hypothetical protein [Arachidicoccus sp. BS20]ANI89236.1 hypothetical protein A9P82_07995 [Arachidicoccus sp. BS20]
MSFITDKQTTDELNLLGRYQSGSVYALFNRTHTPGGEQLLEKLLKTPLTDEEQINRRATVFRYFQQSGYRFPLEREQVELFSNRLDGGGSKTTVGSMFSTLKRKALSSLVHDEAYGLQAKGLTAAATVLQLLYGFLTEDMNMQDNPYEEKIREVQTILTDKDITKLRLLSGKKGEKEGEKKEDLSVKDTAYFDRLLTHTKRKDMEVVLQFIYELDVFMAVGSVAEDRNFTYAEAKPKEGNELKVKGLRHPALKNAVGNDITFNREHNLLFLTGANMAGKSTLMKSIGINLYLAHCGFPVAADEMCFTVKDGLFSSINVPDNISLGYSHFYAEVLRVKQAAELVSQKKSLLVMFDELFKGTNVKDAYEGTLEVTKAFSKYRDCLFIISTHIIEVGEALQNNMNIQFGYMPTEMEGSTPRYPYTLTEGITEDRQGMLIIQNEGILDMLK